MQCNDIDEMSASGGRKHFAIKCAPFQRGTEMGGVVEAALQLHPVGKVTDDLPDVASTAQVLICAERLVGLVCFAVDAGYAKVLVGPHKVTEICPHDFTCGRNNRRNEGRAVKAQCTQMPDIGCQLGV